MEQPLKNFIKRVASDKDWKNFKNSHPDKERLNHILDNPQDMTQTEIEDIVELCNDPEVDYYTIVNNFIARKPKPKRQQIETLSKEDLDLLRMSVSLQLDKISKILGFINERSSLDNNDLKLLFFFLDQLIEDLKSSVLVESVNHVIIRAELIKLKLKHL